MSSSVISFSHFLQRTSEVVEVLGCLPEFSDVLVSSLKSWHWQDKILTPLTQKRLTGIKQYLSVQSKFGVISKLVPSIFVAKQLTVCSFEDHLTSLWKIYDKVTFFFIIATYKFISLKKLQNFLRQILGKC